MNVLLTGGTGYIGSHTAVTLIQKGHNVILFDNLSNSRASIAERVSEISRKSVVFIEGDIRDSDLLNKTLETQLIDAVIHFAGIKAVGESVANPLDYYGNNVGGTINLLKAMRAKSVKILVFSSSATVYGEPQYLPLDENHPTSPNSPYGRSKRHIEEVIADLAYSDADWKIACLRYFNPVGAHESGLIGESPNGVPNNLLPYIAQVATGLRSELNVFGNDYPTPDGTGIRDYIHIMDLAEGHAAALDFLRKGSGWHPINLGTGQGYSVLEIINAFEKISGRKVPYRFAPRRAGDVAEYFASTQKANNLLKWKAKRTLENMCASAWNFQQSFGVKVNQ